MPTESSYPGRPARCTRRRFVPQEPDRERESAEELRQQEDTDGLTDVPESFGPEAEGHDGEEHGQEPDRPVGAPPTRRPHRGRR